MKKVLLTSTALVAFAGAAAAEVTISGWAELGFVGGDGIVTQFWQDVDVDFTMTGETDGGLTFGANVDLDSAGSLGNTTGKMGDVTVFASGEFGTVTMGDTDGALDWALTDAASWGNPGSIDDSETAHWGRQDTYLDGSQDGQILRYDYSFDDFGFAVSLEQDDRSDYELDGSDRDDYNWAVGAKWTPELGAGTLKLGVGYQAADFGAVGFGLTDGQRDSLEDDILDFIGEVDFSALDNAQRGFLTALDDIFGYRPDSSESDELTVSLGADATVWGISAGYEMDNGFSFGGAYSDWDSDALDSGSHWAIGAGYAFDAFSIHANYGEHDFDYKGGSSIKAKGYGVSAGYDLGGGLSILAGYGKSESDFDISGDFVGVNPDGTFDGVVYSVDESFSVDGDTFSLGLSMSF